MHGQSLNHLLLARIRQMTQTASPPLKTGKAAESALGYPGAVSWHHMTRGCCLKCPQSETFMYIMYCLQAPPGANSTLHTWRWHSLMMSRECWRKIVTTMPTTQRWCTSFPCSWAREDQMPLIITSHANEQAKEPIDKYIKKTPISLYHCKIEVSTPRTDCRKTIWEAKTTHTALQRRCKHTAKETTNITPVTPAINTKQASQRPKCPSPHDQIVW